MPEWFWYLVVFVYGAIVGSFLNVIIYRMPLGYSVASPPSHCPRCNRILGFFDNIPLLSFLFLGARCRYCKVPISWRYFTIELMTACLWVALLNRIGNTNLVVTLDFITQALFASILVALIFIDLDHFFVPDELNWIGFTLGMVRDLVCLAFAWKMGQPIWAETQAHFTVLGWLPRALPGAVIYGGLLFLISLFGFIYYARREGESLAGVTRRFFIFEDEPVSEPVEVVPIAAPSNRKGNKSAVATIPEPIVEEVVEDDDDEEPLRLRFSPGFLSGVSTVLLVPTIGWWSLSAFVLPLLAFLLLSRRENEPAQATLTRFFRADDQYSDETTLPVQDAEELTPEDAEELAEGNDYTDGIEPEQLVTKTTLAAEADQFAREAATGQHGGMGLGDVKLALAIGAVLGPVFAPLSLFFATAVGAVTGLTLARIHNRNLRYGLPFVPFMALGAIIVMLFGQALLDWYLMRAGFKVR